MNLCNITQFPNQTLGLVTIEYIYTLSGPRYLYKAIAYRLIGFLVASCYDWKHSGLHGYERVIISKEATRFKSISHSVHFGRTLKVNQNQWQRMFDHLATLKTSVWFSRFTVMSIVLTTKLFHWLCHGRGTRRHPLLHISSLISYSIY